MDSVSKGSSIPLLRRENSIFEEAVRNRSNEIWKQNREKWHAFQACQNHFFRKRKKLSGLESFI